MDLHEQGASSRTFVIAAIVCVLLQAGLAPQISIAGGRVNFMIILVCLSVFSGDPTRAVVCGFCSGLFYDLSAAVPVGVMSLLLTVGSFALVHSAAGQTGGSPSARGITAPSHLPSTWFTASSCCLWVWRRALWWLFLDTPCRLRS